MKFGYNSTIGKKLKDCVSCGKPCYWFSKKRCQQCATIETTQARMEKETNKIIDGENLWDLIHDADAIFSHYVRLKYADSRGFVKCYTCDISKHWTLMQNGHFMKRGNLYLRHDERNCRPQDKHCNEDLDGNLPEFSKRLDAECKGLPDILRAEAVIAYKPTREELRQVIAEYTPKVKYLKSLLK